MAAPTNPFLAVTPTEIQAGKPCKQELKEAFRGNNLRAFEILLAAGVSPDDAAIAIGHRHLGATVDGTAPISLQPQENLIAGGDDPGGFTSGDSVIVNDKLVFETHPGGNERNMARSQSGLSRGTSLTKAFISANIIKKIKSSGGKGRFTCSMHMKRDAAAAGVEGGTLRFGLWDGSAFITGAFVNIAFDDVTTEYQRFYFVSDQITRPAALNVRLQVVADPTDWDTISASDVVGIHGGYMVTNGQGIAKWDISHRDGTGDNYDATENLYWWDEIITEVEKTV